jgi:PAS domain S-box-containing protein
MILLDRHDAPRPESVACASRGWLLRAPRGSALALAAAAAVAGTALFAGFAPVASAALLAASVAGLAAVALAALGREAALRRRLDAHVALSSDWLWEMDADLRFTYLSENFAATTGMPASRVIGRRREDIADAGTRESAPWRAHVADLAARRSFRDFAYDGLRGDGTVHHFRVSGTPVYDAAGRFAGYCGIGRDVSALERAEARVADAIEAMPEGFLLWDAEGKLVMRNRAFGRIDPAADDLAAPGVAFSAFMRARTARGGIKSATGREEAFIAERLAWHRQDEAAPVVVELDGGRWMQLARSRTRDGGTVEIVSDVTELRRQGAERARAESLLVDAIEALNDGFALWDAEDRLVLWNSAAQRYDSTSHTPLRAGVPFAELMRQRVAGGRVREAVGREEEYVAARVAGRRKAGEPPVVMELAEGTWLRVAHYPTRDGGVVAVRTDITDAKRHEAELERARSRLVDAIEAMHDSFVLWDADDRMVVCNSAGAHIDPAAAAILVPGVSYVDFLHRRFGAGDIDAPEGAHEALIRDGLARHAAATGEPFVYRAGERWLSVTQHRTRDGGVVSICSDVTTAKLHQDALARAESRLTDAIEAMSDGFILYDAEDRLVLWNSAIEREDIGAPAPLRHGISYEEQMRKRLAGGWVLDAVGREDAYLAERLVQRARADGRPTVRQLASGRWVRSTERKTREGGLVVIRTDVTELKDRERDLVHARDAAQSASIAKSQFLATMSHELRTPLNAIIGFADLMRNQVYGPLGARYSGYAADIHASGEHLLALITDLLDMSRIEAGRFDLRSEEIALDDVIAEATSMVRGSIGGRGIALTAAIEGGLPMLAGDRRAIKQILVNLLSNAVKFTADGGRVAINARRGADRAVAVAVADNGAGIAPDRLAHIFEPFQHSDANTRRAKQGAGLGLSICKRLADLQGLELEIASTLGGGTTATLRFPATRASSAA